MMKKLILLLLVVCVFILPAVSFASEGYYQKYDQKLLDKINKAYPNEEERLEFCLKVIKTQLKWSLAKYKINYFDCSEQSAFFEFLLEKLGFDTYIVSGKSIKDPLVGHAWIMVKTKDKNIHIESTLLYIIDEQLIRKTYFPEKIYSSIHEIPSYLLDEFNWWERKELKGIV